MRALLSFSDCDDSFNDFWSISKYLLGLYLRSTIILNRICFHVHIYRVLCVNDHHWEIKHYIRVYGETRRQTCWKRQCGVFGLIERGVLIKRELSIVLNGLLSTVLKPTRRGERPVLYTPTV